MLIWDPPSSDPNANDIPESNPSGYEENVGLDPTYNPQIITTIPQVSNFYEGDIFQILFTNSQLEEDVALKFSDLELGNTDLPAGTPLRLSFNYEEGDSPQYIIVSGAKVRGFKHSYPEYDFYEGRQRPGSFTILAESVDPVSSSEGDLNSTFGMIVAMGGEALLPRFDF